MENVLVKRIENSINLKLYFTENSFDWTHDDVYGNEEKTNKYHNRRTFHMFAHCTLQSTTKWCNFRWNVFLLSFFALMDFLWERWFLVWLKYTKFFFSASSSPYYNRRSFRYLDFEVFILIENSFYS